MTPDTQPLSSRQPILGGLLIAIAVLSLFAMLHHPVAHTHGAQSHSEALVRIAGVARLVHGALIVLMIASLVLLAEFATSRLRRPALVRAGFVVYLLGTLLLAGAALVNGFVVPALAQSSAAADPAINTAYALAWQLNQALAGAGTIALAIGMAIWSCDLIRTRGLARIAGAYGLVAGSGLAMALAAGWLQLDVAGMLLALALLAVWQFAAGLLLLRE